MRITYNRKRTQVFINYTVLPKQWLQKKQMVRPPHQREPENNHEFINEQIRTYRKKAEEAISNALKNNIALSDAYFKNWFSGKKEQEGKKSFFDWMIEYINAGKSDKAQRTIKGYITVYNFLKDFEKDTGYSIDITDINMQFFDRFKTYAFIERQVQDNYFAKIVNVLKSFLTWAKERGASVTETYRKFNSPEREKDIIFLTTDELLRLNDFVFANSRLNKARDLYCFGCFTGLRVSDIISLSREHIKGDRIEKVMKKTRVKEIVPLNKFALKILEKYAELPNSLLPVISSQKLNEYVKECCRITEINTPTSITVFTGGVSKEIILPKYELITTHTARKTFLTNSILLGMNYSAAKGISGHKKDKDFNRYVKIAEHFKKKEMERIWDQLS